MLPDKKEKKNLNYAPRSMLLNLFRIKSLKKWFRRGSSNYSGPNGV